MTFDLIIKNGTVLTPEGRKQTDVAVKGGKIAALGDLKNEKASKVVDASGQFVLPGLVDTQVHFREPGLEYKENLEAGTKGAVLGGVTGVFEMPNTNPPTVTPDALADKLNRMKGRAWCNYAFYVGGTPDHDVDWHALEQLPGCCGIKIFMGASTGNLLVEEDAAVERILSKVKRRVSIHSEDNFILKDRKKIAEDEAHVRAHPIWRSKESAVSSTNRLLKIARKTGAKVHVLHISTAEEMEILKNNKDIASVEILANHLTFNSDEYETLGTRIQMNPPIRDKQTQAGLWKAVQENIVDVFGSDHAPHTLEEKAKPYPQSPSGMPGVQTIVPVLLNHINEGRMTLEKLVDGMSGCLSRLWDVKNKGAIKVGYDADITIVDMNKKVTYTDDMMANISGWTPIHGRTLKGAPTYTIIAGKVVMDNGVLDESLKGIGRAFEFDN
jgi:dihydroorotase